MGATAGAVAKRLPWKSRRGNGVARTRRGIEKPGTGIGVADQLKEGDGGSRRHPGLWARARRALLRPRGNRLWDAVVRGTGAVALLGIVLVYLFPRSGPLVGLGIFTIWISGPLSPFFPVGLEPVLMLFGRLYPPWLVAAATTAAGLYIEFLNYYLYGHVAGLDSARSFRESRLVRWSRDLFERRPFFATWFCAWSPVPFWVVRILAPLADYPVGKYLVANLLGRYPKMWFFAAVGVWWSVSDRVLIVAALAGLGLGLVIWAVRSWRVRTGSEEPTSGTGDGPSAGVDGGAPGIASEPERAGVDAMMISAADLAPADGSNET